MKLSIGRLNIEIKTSTCALSTSERGRLQELLTLVDDKVEGFADAFLQLNVIHHFDSDTYTARSKLKLPGRSLFIHVRSPVLHSAIEKCMAELLRGIDEYKANPSIEAIIAADHLAALDRDIVASEDPRTGTIARAAEVGDYRSFRQGLSGYEEWLRKRIGRMIQRYPKAEARLGNGIRLGDLVEQVYLQAFEDYLRRPANVRLSEWLERLVEPSIREYLRHPDREKDAASFARTVCAMAD